MEMAHLPQSSFAYVFLDLGIMPSLQQCLPPTGWSLQGMCLFEKDER